MQIDEDMDALDPSCLDAVIKVVKGEAGKIRESVSSIYKQKEDLDNKLLSLRAVCRHPEEKLMLCEWRVGSTYLASVCTTCDKVIRTATKEEDEEYHKSKYKMGQDTGVEVSTQETII